MIILDTETTDLLKPLKDITENPYIVELCAIKITKRKTSTLKFRCRPNSPMSPEAKKITGISDDMLANEKPFRAHLKSLQDFFLGETILIAHNIDFDVGMLMLDLTRCNAVNKFPWPMTHICTAEFSRQYTDTGYRMRLSELYEYLFGEGFAGAHQAENDVMALHECVEEMIKRGDLVI